MNEREREYCNALAHCIKHPRGENKTTSKEAAQELLFIVSDYIREGRPLPPEAANYLADAMKAIATGTDANKALGLKRTAGQSRDSLENDVKELWIAAEILWLIMMTDGSIVQAKDLAAMKHDLSGRRIEQIWAKWRPHYEAMHLLREFRDTIARIATGSAAPWELLDMLEEAIWSIETCTPEEEQMGVFRSFFNGACDLMTVGKLVNGTQSGSVRRDFHMGAVIRIAREMK